MAEVRLIVSDALVAELQQKLGPDMKATDLTREALTLFRWAVEQRAKGKVLLAAKPEGEDMVQLAMPSLDSVKQG